MPLNGCSCDMMLYKTVELASKKTFYYPGLTCCYLTVDLSLQIDPVNYGRVEDVKINIRQIYMMVLRHKVKPLWSNVQFRFFSTF